TIQTPSLREQLEGAPEQLHNLVLFIARRVAGEAEAEALTAEVEAWIATQLDADYAWPGNVRELEQCVRNVMIRRAYHPPREQRGGPREAFLEAVRTGRLSADDLLRHYCTLAYADTHSYQAAAARLGLDRRTVKSKVDADLLALYGPGRP
ncbi:MAG: sigma-54-dependent Fis family transcriptional regulator, partial [Candidatus Hydrogenedentes bacterium]|nr:sigma-54-dependent Fis family transcriptional regulator [Candidatus Hydrogenedentota bacterium]